MNDEPADIDAPSVASMAAETHDSEAGRRRRPSAEALASTSEGNKPTEESAQQPTNSVGLFDGTDDAAELAAPSVASTATGSHDAEAERAGKRSVLSSFLSLLTNTAPAVEDGDNDGATEVARASHPKSPDAAVVNLSRASLDDDDLAYVLEWLRLLPLHKTRRVDFRFNAITIAGVEPLANWLEQLADNIYSRAPLYARAPIEIDFRNNKIERAAAVERLVAVGARRDRGVSVTVEAGNSAIVVAYPDIDAPTAVAVALESPDDKTFLAIRLRF